MFPRRVNALLIGEILGKNLLKQSRVEQRSNKYGIESRKTIWDTLESGQRGFSPLCLNPLKSNPAVLKNVFMFG